MLARTYPSRRTMSLLLAATALTTLAMVVGLVWAGSPAWAATITVDSLADDADPNDGECTLREAITAANTDTASGPAPGECAAGSGEDVLDIGLTGAVDLTGALPSLSSNIDIEGPGADEFTVNGGGPGSDFRVLTVASGGEVSVSGITVSNGNTRGDGGGIYNDGGTLTVTGSAVSGNTGTRGGGVANRFGALEITGSTVSGNTATNSGGGVYSLTGNLTSGLTTTIANSTISGNTATSEGGGVYNFGGLAVIEFSTITDNTAPDDDGSGVRSSADSSTRTEVLSSIISGNANTDVDSGTTTNSFDSGGYNLVGDGGATGAFDRTGDESGVDDPGLGALTDNGGPTQTHALRSDSSALDAGPPSDSCPPPATDQRGVERPQDGDDDGTGRCDIGSFELEEPPNTAPTVAVAAGGSCGANHRSATVRLRVADADDPASGLSLSAASSNRALVPDANITFGGAGTNRTMEATALPRATGSTSITLTVSDGQETDRTTVAVTVAGGGDNTLEGGERASVLLGRDGDDKLRGDGGKDVLCGGRGEDRLRGGAEADFFGGGPGTDAAIDFDAGQGDRMTGIP